MTTIRQIERYADIMFAFEPKIRYFAEVESAEGAVFCAYEDGEPIGLVCLRKQINAFDIAYLYTKETHRRQGIAGNLMDHALDFNLKKGRGITMTLTEKFKELKPEQRDELANLKDFTELDAFTSKHSIELSEEEKLEAKEYLESGKLPLGDDELDMVAGGASRPNYPVDDQHLRDGRYYPCRKGGCNCIRIEPLYAKSEESGYSNELGCEAKIYKDCKCYICNKTFQEIHIGPNSHVVIS